MLHLQKILGFLFFITIFSSCYKDDIVSTETIDLISAERIYLNTIKGQVLDTLGDPIPSVLIEMGDENTLTDDEGKFVIVDVMIRSTGEFISATHPEYYEGGTRVYATAPITQTVQINLVPRGITQNFTNAQGATLKVADLTEVTIPTNAFWSQNQLYEGMVTLEVYTVNPNESQSYNKRLQVFEIYEASSFEKILKSDLSSMMYIEAYDVNGTILNVAPDKKIRVSIPNYGNSQVDIPLLFSFNEEMGFWNFEDEAQIDADQYNFELSHFSWWGVGSKKTATDLCLTLTNVNPKDDHLFTVSTTAGKVLHLGGVNYEEVICFPAPANETLEIRIFNSCFTEIFGTTVTTEMQKETNVTIDVESLPAHESLIEIEVVDCDFSTLQDTVTIFYASDLSIDSLDKGVGTFELRLDECFRPSEIALIAVQDLGNVKYTFSERVVLNETQSQYNIQIVACQDVMPIDGHLTINGITYSKVVARRNPQETLIIATEGDDEVVIGFDGFDIGTHPGRVISFKENVFCEGKVSISLYGEMGDFIEGTFEIPSNASLGCESIIGDFRAMREN